MTNLSIVSPDGVSENQVIRSNVAKTQQPDAERLMRTDNNEKSVSSETRSIRFEQSEINFNLTYRELVLPPSSLRLTGVEHW